MTLRVKVTAESDDGGKETMTQDFTDTPILATAINRAKELAMDHYTWGVPGDARWTKVAIEVEVFRG